MYSGSGIIFKTVKCVGRGHPLLLLFAIYTNTLLNASTIVLLTIHNHLLRRYN